MVGESLGPFASVVTSASPRAIETAVAMGFAVDDTVERPSGYVPGEVDHHDQWRWPRPYRSYAELIGRGGGLAAVAQTHRRIWMSVVGPCPTAPPPWSSVMAVGSSRGWWPVCRTPTTSRGARRSPTVKAHASASTTAVRQRPVPPGAGGAATQHLQGRWAEGRSFRWSFPQVILSTTGRHQVDDVPDLSSNNGTQRDGSDGR
jgi:hypothetical protein